MEIINQIWSIILTHLKTNIRILECVSRFIENFRYDSSAFCSQNLHDTSETIHHLFARIFQDQLFNTEYLILKVSNINFPKSFIHVHWELLFLTNINFLLVISIGKHCIKIIILIMCYKERYRKSCE